MAWQQTRYPNLDNDPNHPLYVYVGGQLLYDWYCWCLAVCLASVGSGWTADCAWTAWEVNQTNTSITTSLMVSLSSFITRAELTVTLLLLDVVGLRFKSGLAHIPKATYDYFEGDIQVINKVGAIYGVSYVGWSETIGDTAIAKYVAPAPATPTPEPQPEPEPEPEPEPIPDPVIDDDNNNGDGSDVEPVNKEEYEEMAKKNKEIAAKMLGGLEDVIEEGGDIFHPSDKAKLIAYLVGDFFIVAAMMTPLIINCILAPDLNTFGTALATALSELGAAILLIFKLVKKK